MQVWQVCVLEIIIIFRPSSSSTIESARLVVVVVVRRRRSVRRRRDVAFCRDDAPDTREKFDPMKKHVNVITRGDKIKVMGGYENPGP